MKTETKHTPGPWKIASRQDVEDSIVIHQVDKLGGEIAIASALFTQMDESEAKANARLISVAPELLAACENAEYCLDFANSEIVSTEDLHRTLNALRAAIAKAKGTQS